MGITRYKIFVGHESLRAFFLLLYFNRRKKGFLRYVFSYGALRNGGLSCRCFTVFIREKGFSRYVLCSAHLSLRGIPLCTWFIDFSFSTNARWELNLTICNTRTKGFVRYIIEIKAQRSAVRYVMEFPKSRRALKSYNKKKQSKVKNHITPETKLILLNLIFCYLWKFYRCKLFLRWLLQLLLFDINFYSNNS